MDPYYTDDLVTLYHGDCLEIDEWLDAAVLVTDPPYGRAWKQGQGLTNSSGRGRGSKAAPGIANDESTATRDAALTIWGSRPAVVFGDPLISQPPGAVQALAYHKGIDAGVKGARGGFRRDLEMIYLCGPWPPKVGGSSSVLWTGTLVAGPTAPSTVFGHPHSKPIPLMERLIERCPPGVIADPFAGSGATLLAAVNQGRRAIGVELEERYCEIIARRLSNQTMTLDFEDAS